MAGFMDDHELYALREIPRREDVALFIGPDDGLVFDSRGNEWMVGQLNGERVRRLVRHGLNWAGGLD